MKLKLITYFSITGILIILLSQAYIVVENYKETRVYLTQESNAILESAFRNDLTIRVKLFKRATGESAMVAPQPHKPENIAKVDMSKAKDLGDNALGTVDLAINNVISSKAPLQADRLDSVTGVMLQQHNIHSPYVVNVLDSESGRVLQHSKKDIRNSVFSIQSKKLLVDFQRKTSLQLVLINPFSSVFKRMGMLLSASILIALFCFYGLWFLFRTQARQKKLMEVKNDFFGHTAHELKRPVAQLHLALEALSRPAIDENKAKKERYLAISKEATKDMSEKITMIMTLSMAEEGVFNLNYSDFNLMEEVQKLKEQFSAIAEKEISIQIENAAADIQIKADKDHLRQCIANLIDNAIKYSGVSVQICISVRRIKDLLMLSVRDNGNGIRPEKLGSVFEKYTRLNPEAGSPSGFGIGLSYVKAVVEKHAGHIEVHSEPGKGSEFILSLPA
jgi:two-component system phosphate regulon sensor histidine kinase PhoR